MDKSIEDDEYQLLWDHIYFVSRLMRGQGDFESAKIGFESCSVTNWVRPSKKIILQCALVEFYCELDYSIYSTKDDRHQYLYSNSKSLRRLLLSLSEVYIRQGLRYKAREVLERLSTPLEKVDSIDAIDRLGHVRLYIALARSCPPWQAEPYGKEALRLNATYKPEEFFTCAVIYLNLNWLGLFSR
ncbi:hypothetical protein F5883DRAFT_424986 [Diaporthe sp. PMI_573]|nr:hypothetical protein F5883DRAFT_424986 [Diaporthaceae sp. PMI_573]